MTRFARALLALTIALFHAPAYANGWVEVPSLQPLVAAGQLPPVAERVPSEPRVVDVTAHGRQPGKHGGEMRLLMGDVKDLRMIIVYSYARLVGLDENLQYQPDILASFDVQEGRIFTFRLRAGHRWSDGQPFTTEDFRYFWQDVALNKKLSPNGPPVEMVVDGESPKVEILDTTTVRYTWSKPNPRFLPSLSGPRPLVIAMPAHYLKNFHEKYRDAKELEALAKSQKVQNWARLHERNSRHYRPENPELPVLDPWVNSTKPPSTRFVFKRNPFFHRTDGQGRQLPYIDQIAVTIVSPQLIPAKVATGETDLQGRYLRFDNYTFLKAAEAKGKFRVDLWERTEGSAVALFPNLNATDEGWRAVFRDVNVRRALSLGINRREISKAIFYGLASESSNTVLPVSPLFRPEYAMAWSAYDIETANGLLDKAGLNRRGLDGVRLLPDGRRAEIIIETAGESTQETDVLNLVRDSWSKIGIRLFVRTTQRDLLRDRVFIGDTLLSTWAGVDDGVPFPDTMPIEFVPTAKDQLQWSRWGAHFEAMGKAGEPVDMPKAAELLDLLKAWRAAPDVSGREAAWHKILQLNADQVFTIGTVNRVKQPIVVSNRLRNVPKTGLFGFEPSAYFGIYKPDTFWISENAP